MADTPVNLAFWQTPTPAVPVHLLFGEGRTSPPPTGATRVFNGTEWLTATAKRWDGATWAPVVMKGRGESTWHAGSA